MRARWGWKRKGRRRGGRRGRQGGEVVEEEGKEGRW